MKEIVIRIEVPESFEEKEVKTEIENFVRKNLLLRIMLKRVNRALSEKQQEIGEEYLVKLGDWLKEKNLGGYVLLSKTAEFKIYFLHMENKIKK